MSERDKSDSEFRAAIIVPQAARREQERVEILASVIGTNQEIIDEAINALEEQIGSPVLRLTPNQARMERNRFYFSSSTWNARWEPTGPNASYKARLN